MTAAPNVYIAGVLMDSYAVAEVPMLAGLNFNWGNESQVEFEAPATLSAQLLVRVPSTLEFLSTGAEFGLVDPASGATLFAGRVATLKATPDSRISDALLISLTAADTNADLNEYRVENIDWVIPGGTSSDTTADVRRDQIRAVMPDGWTLQSTTAAYDWTTAREQRWQAKPILPVLDMHLRSTISRRHNTTRYIPGTGLAPRITIAAERAKDAPAETLATKADGTWYMSTAAPRNTAFIQLEAGHVAADIEWEKTPDDTITDVQLHSKGVTSEYNSQTGTVELSEESNSSYDIWVNLYPNVDNTAIQRKYGFHQLELDVDTLGGGQESPHVGFIVNYWVDADAQWRPTGVHVPDSRVLADAEVLGMLDVERRYNAYVTVSGLPANNPAGGSRVRGYAIAGDATWDGDKWQINLTLGRVPHAPAAAGVLDFDDIQYHANAAISGATDDSIGTRLSFADFAYIGA